MENYKVLDAKIGQGKSSIDHFQVYSYLTLKIL